jgi:hypothetical protein
MLHLIFILHRSNNAVKNLEDILLKSVGPALVLGSQIIQASVFMSASVCERNQEGGGGIKLIRARDFLTAPLYPHHFYNLKNQLHNLK